MAKILIRVELVGSPSFDIYTKLHTYMSSIGFEQSFVTKAGTRVDLPHAMYQGNSTSSTSSLCTKIKDHVKSAIWTKPFVLVAEYTDFTQSKA